MTAAFPWDRQPAPRRECEVEMCLGVPGRIVEIHEDKGLRMARVDFGGVFREACLDYVPEAKVGDYCIIHVGFAISLVSEAEAKETLELLDQIAKIEDEVGPGFEPLK
ncbi:MAG: HypC/HybG/HupF family hydrogenase formation chaperone [Bacteroidota bacterium]